MASTRRISHNPGIKFLIRAIFRHGSGNHICTGLLTVQFHHIVTDCILIPMSHQPLPYYQLCSCRQFRLRLPICRIHPFNLHHLHLHGASLLHGNFRDRIQNSFAIAVSLTIMFLYIFYSGIFSHIKTVNPLMLRILISTIVNATTGHNHHITILTNIEIIINHILHATLTQYYRNMHTLLLCPWPDANVNPTDLRL